MKKYIVFCEDHSRNIVIIGNDKGDTMTEEQANNLAKELKSRMPLREFKCMPIEAVKVDTDLPRVISVH